MTLPYMPLFVSDYLADTPHLTTEEHGAYFLLMMNYWQTTKPLDNENERLASVAKLSPKRWAIVSVVLKKFFTVEGDLWTHGRIEYELEKVLSRSTKASYAGKQSGRARAAARLALEQEFNDRSTKKERPLNHKDKDKDKDKDTKYTAAFETFWQMYPRKDGSKLKASLAFAKALKKVELQEIMQGLKRYAEDPNRDPAYTKHGATWLNGECWNDAPLPQRKLTPQQKSELPTPIPPRRIREPEIVRTPEELQRIADTQAQIRKTLEEKRIANLHKKEGKK